MDVVTAPQGGLRIGRDGRLLVLRWAGKPTRDTLAFALNEMQRASIKHGKLVTLSVHHASDPKPGPATVARLVATASDVSRQCELQVVILVGASWGASIAHSIFGRVILASERQSAKVVRDLEAGVDIVAVALERDPIALLLELEKHKLLPIPV